MKKALGDRIYKKVTSFVGTRAFFYIIITVTILQGLWYALSFKPGIFDEGYHFGLTNIYTSHPNPFITSQTDAWDKFGNITRNPSYLYYYLLSWPLRLIKLFSHSEALQVFGLRVIMLACFLGGLYYFSRLLLRLGASKPTIHVALLLLILTPKFAPFAGALNYDTVIFLITPITFLWAIDILESRGTDIVKLIAFIILGVFGTLVMFSYLALYAPLFIYLIYKVFRQEDKRWFFKIKKSLAGISKINRAFLILVLCIAVGLFIERPVYNIYRYHNISPSCTRLMSEQRCLKNYTAARDIEVTKNKPSSFKPVNPIRFLLTYWIPGLWSTAVKVAPSSEDLPNLQFMYALASLIGIGLVLVYLRDFLTKNHFAMVISVSLIYALFLAADNYSAYRRLGQPAAIDARYILPVLPIFIYLASESVNILFGKHKTYLLIFASLVIIVLITQGGSIGSASLTQELHDDLWQNSKVLTANRDITAFFHKIIIERSGL